MKILKTFMGFGFMEASGPDGNSLHVFPICVHRVGKQSDPTFMFELLKSETFHKCLQPSSSCLSHSLFYCFMGTLKSLIRVEVEEKDLEIIWTVIKVCFWLNEGGLVKTAHNQSSSWPDQHGHAVVTCFSNDPINFPGSTVQKPKKQSKP